MSPDFIQRSARLPSTSSCSVLTQPYSPPVGSIPSGICLNVLKEMSLILVCIPLQRAGGLIVGILAFSRVGDWSRHMVRAVDLLRKEIKLSTKSERPARSSASAAAALASPRIT